VAVRTQDRSEPAGTPRGLVVVGDMMLDRDVIGEADRLSPEAPVPVVEVGGRKARPGGAGLAAMLAARSRGWTVTLLTACGFDDEGDEVRRMLHDAGIGVVNLAVRGRTAVKSRIRVRDRTLLRFDEEPGPPTLGPLPAAAEDALYKARAVLVCDYGRGVTAHPALRSAIAESAARVPVVWDPYPRGSVPVEGVALVVPNNAEARQAVSTVEGVGLAADVQRARRLLREWPVRQVAVTRGAAGALLVQDFESAPLVIPAESAVGSDECGAGDSFAVAATLSLGRGRTPSEAVSDAVQAASRYVARGGPAGLSADIGAGPPGDIPDAATVAARVRASGGRVVATGGCFDLLHVGHLSLLESARRLGDCLVVCLNSDESVTRLKGPDRPLMPHQERAAMLLALGCVDAVTIFGEETPAQALAAVRPDIYVKGGDYAIGRLPEQPLVESWGGQVVVVPYLQGRSTTSLIKAAGRQTSDR
jgi:D-beta-D-heptose 7-phosphate kinase / D-beta-D-heptose 1-phosphate adenosyltransferase